MRLLRDKAGLTRLLLLLECQRAPPTRLRDLAERLGITVQAVSQHVAALEREGALRAGAGRYELSPAGAQRLQATLAELKGFVDLAYQRASVVEHCSALASGKVRAGDAVGLFLEGGVLVARPRAASPSRGIAAHAAGAGELLRVRDLEGLVALQPGRLVVLKVPLAEGAQTGRVARALRAWARSEGPAQVAAVGTEAQVLARAAGLQALLFAPAHAAHHAAQLGLDAAVLASPGQARFVTAELDRLNGDALHPVRYEVRELRAPPAGRRRA